MTDSDRPAVAPGTVVGHANPELADWAGTVTVNRAGNWQRRAADNVPEVWVEWHAGTAGDDGALADCKPGWMPVGALTVKGECPDCARPAHYVPAGDGKCWDQSEGWAHDSQRHAMTCWAGKAAFEASYPALASD